MRNNEMLQDDTSSVVKKLLSNGSGALLVWGFRLLLICVVIWFKAEFVTKDDYLKDQNKQIIDWTKLTSTLTHIDDVLTKLDKDDDDQEKRLRDLERRK
jgi:hypothetical protein